MSAPPARAIRRTPSRPTLPAADPDLADAVKALRIGPRAANTIPRATTACPGTPHKRTRAAPVAKVEVKKGEAFVAPAVTATPAVRRRVVAPTTSTTAGEAGGGSGAVKTPAKSRTELAGEAKLIINTSLKSLSLAVSEGYRYPSSASSSLARTPARKTPSEWTDEGVLKIVDACGKALQELRGLVENAPGETRCGVERTAGGVVSKCISMGMYTKALTLLSQSRPTLLSLYPHPTPPSPSPSFLPSTTPTSKKSTTPRTPSRARLAPPQKGVKPEWVALLSLPAPDGFVRSEERDGKGKGRDGMGMGEMLEGVVFGHLCMCWVGVLGVSKSVQDHSLILPIITTPEANLLQPFDLSSSLLTAQKSPLLLAIYRHLTHLSPSLPSLPLPLHLSTITLTLTTLSALAATGVGSVNLWGEVRRLGVGVLERGEEGGERGVMEVIEGVVRGCDGEDGAGRREGGDGGRGWVGLMEFWVGLGRRTKDLAAMKRATALMALGTTASSTAQATSDDLAARMSGLGIAGPGGIAAVEAELGKICAGWARLSVGVEKEIDSTHPDPEILSALNDTQTFRTLLTSLLSLPADEQLSALTKISRHSDRVRRAVCAALGVIKARKMDGEVSAGGGVEEGGIRWLGGFVGFVEGLFEGLGDAEPISQARPDFGAAAVEAIIHLSRHIFLPQPSPSNLTALKYISRSLNIITASRAPETDRADWLRCISSCVYNMGGSLWRKGEFFCAIDFIRQSALIGWDAVVLRREVGGVSELEKKEGEDVWVALEDQIAKRWELLAVCLYKSGEKMTAVDAYMTSLVKLPSRTIDVIIEMSSSLPICDIFSQLPAVQSVIQRMAATMTTEALLYRTAEKTVLSSAVRAGAPRQFIGALGEAMISILQEAEHRGDVALLMGRVLEELLVVYDAEDFPVRRLRVLVRLLDLSISAKPDERQVRSCKLEIESLSKHKALGEDSNLLAYRSQYLAEVEMRSAVDSFSRDAKGVTRQQTILKHAQVVKELLRSHIELPTSPMKPKQIVKKAKETLPKTTPARGRRVVTPSRNRAVNEYAVEETPAVPTLVPGSKFLISAKRWDDATRLCVYLDSFVNLLEVNGLTLVKIEILRLLRLLQRTEDPAAYLATSARLALEYASLDKVIRAGTIFAQAHNLLVKGTVDVTDAQSIDFNLKYALFQAGIGNSTKSANLYETAKQSSDSMVVSTSSGTAKSRERAASWQRSAEAYTVAAELAFLSDDANAGLSHTATAFRLHLKTVETLSRIAPEADSKAKRQESSDNPFAAPVIEKGETLSTRSKGYQPLSGRRLGGLQLRAATALLECAFKLAEGYLRRGSARDAESILSQARDLAESVESPVMTAKVNYKSAEISQALKQYQTAKTQIAEAQESLADLEGPESIHLSRIAGDLAAKQNLLDEAKTAVQLVEDQIRALGVSFETSDAIAVTPKKESLFTSTQVARTVVSKDIGILHHILGHVLRQYAWLLRQAGEDAQSEEILERALALPRSASLSAPEQNTIGKITLSKALAQFKSDLFLCSLTESTISIPVGCSIPGEVAEATSKSAMIAALQDAEFSFVNFLSLQAHDGTIEEVRSASLSIALMRAYQASLGKTDAQDTNTVASLLDASSSLTLRRELLEAVANKTRVGPVDDETWPEIPVWADETDMSVRLPSRSRSRSTRQPQTSPLGSRRGNASAAMTDNVSDMTPYWESVALRHKNFSGLSPIPAEDMARLPPHWAVVNISVADDSNTLLISRHQRDRPPIVFCLPLDRQARRDGSDGMTFDDAIGELRDIIDSSDKSARDASGVQGNEAKLQWWANRKELDRRLGALLASIELCWLGAFKTIFNPADGRSPSALTSLRTSLEKIFKQALSHGHNKGKIPRLKLDDSIIECFSTLDLSKGEDDKSDQLEDLVYYLLDVHQFSGIPVAVAELDVDQLGIDVDAALNSFKQARRTESISPIPDEHIFLVLDRKVSEIPWESIPILRGRAISRVPSLAFILDRLSLLSVKHEQETVGPVMRSLKAPRPATPDPDDPRFTVDPRKTFYVLNPSKDLVKTQGRFEGWLGEMKGGCGWEGRIGVAPMEMEFANALASKDLMLYFGHGGAEQYVKSLKIRNLDRCATTMLWGCSSGALRDQGDLDRTGTPWHYMIAGCPSLVANLWDVTDKDIDMIADGVFKDLKLDITHVPAPGRALAPLSGKAISNVQAVGRNRDTCKLKYLTGAAPVVYGIPVYFR